MTRTKQRHAATRSITHRMPAILWPLVLLACMSSCRLPAQQAPPSNLLLVTSFGAKGDMRPVGHLSIAAGSRTLAAGAGTFNAGDVGRVVAGASMGADGRPVSVTSQITAVAPDGGTATLLDQAPVALTDAAGEVGTDNAKAIQGCWDASAARGLVCWFPAGQYLYAARPLVVRSHMSVEGGAPALASLVCAPSVRDCVTLDEGPVQFVSITRMELRGTEGSLPAPREGSAAQRGFHLVAHGTGGGAGGGLWQSTLAHVQISEFWGDEFALEGGRGEFMHPNQFLFLEDLELQTARGRPGMAPPVDSYRLRLTGQDAQIIVSGGQIHGAIGSQMGNGVLIDGAGVVRFEGTTCEWLDLCLDVRNGQTIRYTDGWMENVKRVATLGAAGVRAFTLDHTYLANSCFDGRHGGWCIKLSSAAADTGVSFAHNDLAWGAAPPDALVQAPPGAHVEVVDTLGNGQPLPPLTPAHAVTPGTSWRKAAANSGWVAPGARTAVHLQWAPSPFPTENFTASCSSFGARAAVRVDGITRQTAEDLEVVIENTDPRSPQRARVECVGMQ